MRSRRGQIAVYGGQASPDRAVVQGKLGGFVRRAPVIQQQFSQSRLAMDVLRCRNTTACCPLWWLRERALRRR